MKPTITETVPSGTPAEERETIIRWDDEEKTVIIWTASAAVYRKLPAPCPFPFPILRNVIHRRTRTPRSTVHMPTALTEVCADCEWME